VIEVPGPLEERANLVDGAIDPEPVVNVM